jgi:hypothetical protein
MRLAGWVAVLALVLLGLLLAVSVLAKSGL